MTRNVLKGVPPLAESPTRLSQESDVFELFRQRTCSWTSGSSHSTRCPSGSRYCDTRGDPLLVRRDRDQRSAIGRRERRYCMGRSTIDLKRNPHNGPIGTFHSLSDMAADWTRPRL